jgi:hypothetical protein
MMNLKRALLPVLLVAAAGLALPSASDTVPRQVSPTVALRYTTAQESFSVHEPIVVLFSVANNLPNTITLALGAQDIQFFEFALASPAGQQVHEYWNMNQEVSLVTIGSGKVQVPPGESYKLPLLMNRWFHFEAPGTYFLTLRLSTNIEVSNGSNIAPQSQTLRLTIRPRNAATLERICANLVKEVAAAPNAKAAQEPARRLSYIRDPVALPYLAKLLQYNKLTDHFVVAGLERIDTDDAARVLLSLLNSNFADRASLSCSALLRMQSRIHDPAVKKAVKLALTVRAEGTSCGPETHWIEQ